MRDKIVEWMESHPVSALSILAITCPLWLAFMFIFAVATLGYSVIIDWLEGQ